MEAPEAERRRVSLVAQAMSAPWEDRCDQDMLERRLKEWEASISSAARSPAPYQDEPRATNDIDFVAAISEGWNTPSVSR